MDENLKNSSTGFELKTEQSEATTMDLKSEQIEGSGEDRTKQYDLDDSDESIEPMTRRSEVNNLETGAQNIEEKQQFINGDYTMKERADLMYDAINYHDAAAAETSGIKHNMQWSEACKAKFLGNQQDWDARRLDPYDCMAFEFQPENVAPYHEDTRLFVRPQWPFSWCHFVIYRIVLAVLITVWVIIDFLDEAYHFYSDNYGIWFVFATNWSFLLLSVSAVVRAVGAAIHFTRARRYDPDDETERPYPTSVFIMALWIIYNMAANGALVVTFSYWTFLAAFDNSGFLATYMSQLKHSLNTAYILMDLLISATPIRIFHLIYPMFVGAVYTLFNALYFINNGVGPDGKPYAYYVMDWRNPIESAVTCSLGFIMTTVVQVVLYGLYRFRLMMYRKFLQQQQQQQQQHHGVIGGGGVGGGSSEHHAETTDDERTRMKHDADTVGNMVTKTEVQGILHPSNDQRASYSSLEQMEMLEAQTVRNP